MYAMRSANIGRDRTRMASRSTATTSLLQATVASVGSIAVSLAQSCAEG